MALTSDEIKQILELRAKKYSHRKNAEKTGHSEITVRKVINEAEGQVISLKAKGLEMEQIAKELDYPLAFVRNTVDKPGSLSVEPLEVDVEQRESPETPDLKTGWAGFKRLQEIGSAAKRLQQQADKLIDDLQELEMQLKAERIVSADWYQRKQLSEGQLRNFVLEEVQIIDSEESVSALEGVIEEIKEKVSSLCQVYRPKVKEAKKLRSLQEQKHSDQLLDEKIDIPMFPGFVKKYIKSRFLVKTEKEASTIADAMFQFALFTDRDSKGNSKYAEKMWRVVFITAIEEGGWNSLERWAAQYRKDTEEMLLSIGVCPRCEANLTREHAPGKEILRCPSCNSSWTSARKA